MVDGKLNIWIKKGKFSFSNDLYVKVLCDEKQIGKTDEKDSTRPEWDHKMVKKIDGPYEKLVFQLLDEDTFSRDDLLGSAEVKIEDIAQAGGSLTRVKSSTVSGEIDLYDADGKKIGYIDLSIEFEKDA